MQTELTRLQPTVFKGRALHVDVLGVELPDGRESVREVIRHPGAAVIPARRRVAIWHLYPRRRARSGRA